MAPPQAEFVQFFIPLVVILCFYYFNRLFKAFVLHPAAQRRVLLSQGIHVKPYRLFSGDLAEIKAMEAHVQKKPLPSASDHHLLSQYQYPFMHKRISEINSQGAGSCANFDDRPFVYWEANCPIVMVTNPEDIKCVMLAHVNQIKKPQRLSLFFTELLGTCGLLLSDGEQWQIHRNILRPGFFAEKLKEMVPDMVVSALVMVDSWNQRMSKDGQPTELEIAKDLKNVTADILARTSFGSSYIQGRRVFEKQVQILDLAWNQIVKRSIIPGYRYISTAENRKIRKLEKAVKIELKEIIESCKDTLHSNRDECKTDLLTLMLSADTDKPYTTDQILDECRTFFFAGHETTANLLAWTMVLLSVHPEWQERVRKEVLEFCGSKGEIKHDHINKMKILTMVIYETLRLYPPVPEHGRRIIIPNQAGFKLGDRTLPNETEFSVPCLFVHRRKDLWGDDADVFNPERFANGITKACKHPYAFIPFSQGPRICIGQNFALMEAKAVMAVILQRFCFRLSPTYKHSPITTLTMKPKHGLQVILEPVM